MPRYNDLMTNESLYRMYSGMNNLVFELKYELQLEETMDSVLYGEGMALTPGAQLMLLIPIAEARALGDVNANTETIRTSLQLLVEEAKVSPARVETFPDALTMEDASGKEWPMRSSLSVIKSFWAKFCNIPPFCGERG